MTSEGNEPVEVLIIGTNVTLVPYTALHVPTYHSWMSSPHLLECTASERLSLEEEYDMCEKWRVDRDKVTFIIYGNEGGKDEAVEEAKRSPKEFLESNKDRMVGDVNVFIKEEDGRREGEIEIMIAEESSRRKGYASEAVGLMVRHSVASHNLERIFCKIGEDNAPSLSFFVDKLGFEKVKYVECFREWELEMKSDVGLQGVEVDYNTSDLP